MATKDYRSASWRTRLALCALSTAASLACAAEKNPSIRFKRGSFDPLTSSARTASNLGEAGVYLVQFQSRPGQAEHQRLKALGGKVHHYVPDNALVVRFPAGASLQAAGLAGVRWVGPLTAEDRLASSLQESGKRKTLAAGAAAGGEAKRYSILLFERDEASRKAVAQRIRELGGQVHMAGPRGRLLDATLTPSAMRQLALASEVQFIEPWSAPSSDEVLYRDLGGANVVETESVAHYKGEGVNGEVMDGGFFTTHQEFLARPPRLHGTNGSDTSHGTAVGSIVFASGVNTAARGILPMGNAIFAAYPQLASGGRYAHTQELVNPTGTYRAVFQTNSWGSALTTEYTAISADMDDMIFDLDLLLTQSQSNDGTRNSRPQAWAKNVVSIGGVRGYGTASKADDCWCGSPGTGGSIGPASDGRVKPDLSHIYDAKNLALNTSATGYTSMNGTSFSTPAVGGLFGLLFQMWADGVLDGGPGKNRDVFDSRPHAATAKALMINMASQYTFSGATHDLTRVHQGWGFADVGNVYRVAQAANWRLPILIDESAPITQGQSHSYAVDVSGSEPLKVTLVYRDPAGSPAAAVDRVNDLSLKLTSPNGTIYWGNNGLLEGNWSTAGGAANTVDTVENVFIQNPQVGRWTVEVVATEVVQDGHVVTPALDAVYALVGTRGLGSGLPSVSAVTSVPTASEAGLVPGAITLSRTGATTAALTVRYSVSGTATAGSDYQALTGTAVIPAGSASVVVPVQPIDDTLVESAESVVLTLTAGTDYQISGGSATVSISSDDQAPVPPTVSAVATTAVAREAGLVPGVVTVSRSGAMTAALSVAYTVSGTAAAGSDYQALSGTLTIPAGSSSATITVTPINDTLVEPDETVQVTLSPASAYTVGGSAATVTVVSDDAAPLPSISVLASTPTAREAGPVNGQFTISRSGATTAALTVNYSVSGAATSGSDYTALSGSVTLAAGASSAVVNVVPINDTAVEPDETVVLTLSASSTYSGGGSSGTVSIVCDDVANPVQQLKANRVFDNKNNKAYTSGDPLNDINSTAEEKKLEVESGSSYWWEIEYANAVSGFAPPSAVVALEHRAEAGWSGTLTLQLINGSTVLGSRTVTASSSKQRLDWDVSSLLNTEAKLNAAKIRAINQGNGKKVWLSYSLLSAQ